MSGVTARFLGPLAAILLCAGSLHGQQSPQRVDAGLEVGMRGSTLRGSTEAFWGGVGLLHVHPRVSVGGAGWLLVGRSEIVGTSSGSDLELSFGYGGAVADVLLHGSQRSRISLRTLVGAGNAKALVPVVGSEDGADNFGIVEPEVVAAFWLAELLSVRASVSYRFAYGVEDLSQAATVVTSSDLSGMSLALAFGIGRP